MSLLLLGLVHEYLIFLGVYDIMRETKMFQEILGFSLTNRAWWHSSLPSAPIQPLLLVYWNLEANIFGDRFQNYVSILHHYFKLSFGKKFEFLNRF